MGLEIFYTDHAVERMVERKIYPLQVREMLTKPDDKIRQSRDKWIYYKKFEKRTDNDLAAVVVEVTAQRIDVITVMVNFEART